VVNQWWACKVSPQYHYRTAHPAALGYEAEPAMEAYFRILGSGVLHYQLILVLYVYHEDLPLTTVSVDRWNSWSAALPDLIKDFNRQFTASRVTIMREVASKKDLYAQYEKDFRKTWNILWAEDGPGHIATDLVLHRK
jgi:hypothetical protein